MIDRLVPFIYYYLKESESKQICLAFIVLSSSLLSYCIILMLECSAGCMCLTVGYADIFLYHAVIIVKSTALSPSSFCYYCASSFAFPSSGFVFISCNLHGDTGMFYEKRMLLSAKYIYVLIFLVAFSISLLVCMARTLLLNTTTTQGANRVCHSTSSLLLLAMKK